MSQNLSSVAVVIGALRVNSLGGVSEYPYPNFVGNSDKRIWIRLLS